jgi:hypothetical protein
MKKQVVSLKESLESKKVEELKELAAEFPEELTKDLRLKKDYVDFLVTQLEVKV